MSSGGARPGAGRKPKADKKVELSMYVTPDVLVRAKRLKAEGVNLSEMVSELILSYTR